MSTQPVTVDMSTFKPLPAASAAASPSTGQTPTGTAPSVDMSTFKPLAGQEQPQGLTPEEMGTMGANAVTGALGMTSNPLTAGAAKGAGETLHTIGRLINKATGDNVPWLPTSLEQPKELGSANAGETAGKIGESLAEFALGDETLKGLPLIDKLKHVEVIANLADKSPFLAKLIKLGMSSVEGGLKGAITGGAVGGLHGGAEGAETGAEVGGAFGAVAPVAAAAKNAVKGAVRGATAPVEGAIEFQVGKAVGESGIAEGAAPSEPPSGENIQPDLQREIHSVSQGTAKESGVPYQKAPSIRDSVGTTSREILKKSRADFSALDEASGGRWQRFADSIENIQKKMNEIAGIDDDAYGNLESKRNEIQTLQAQLVEDLKAGGKVDPAIADRANAAYRQSMALSDLSDAVKASTKRVASGETVTEAVDPASLSNRLSKLSDTPLRGGESRLETAVGAKGAQQLRDATDAAHIATQKIKDFVPTEATGKQALETMVRNATNTKKFGGAATDWNAVRNQFERLKPEAQQQIFGNDVGRLRIYLNQQALKQAAMTVLKRGAGALALGGAAGLGGVAVHELTK